MHDLIEYEPEEQPLAELTGELTFEGDFIADHWEEGYDY